MDFFLTSHLVYYMLPVYIDGKINENSLNNALKVIKMLLNFLLSGKISFFC